MKKIVGSWLRRMANQRSGFTLVELLVVVAIIVGLAAVVAPRVSQFSNKGSDGALAAELQNVQAAMDTMMADNGINLVTAVDLGVLGTSTNTWTAAPVEGFLDAFLREDTTKYFYCWSSNGKVTEQTLTAVACTI